MSCHNPCVLGKYICTKTITSRIYNGTLQNTLGYPLKILLLILFFWVKSTPYFINIVDHCVAMIMLYLGQCTYKIEASCPSWSL